jgi:DNA-binding LacI/PurR family transcriptional regulator
VGSFNVVGLKQVAAAARVSIRTAARALNRQGYVGSETRERVEKAAVKLGYRPNRVARSLRTQKSYEIAIAAWSTDELHIAKIEGFEQAVRRARYAVTILMSTQPDAEAAGREVLETILEHRPAAVAAFPLPPRVMTETVAELTKSGIPYVIFDSRMEGVDSARLDRAQGVYEAVLYLAAKGHQRIAYLGSREEPSRLDGYLRAVSQLARVPHYLEVTPRPQTPGGLESFEAGRAAAWTFAELEERPDAVQAYSDELALGFLSGLHELGFRVPQDVAVVGFDDRRAASLSWPRLTTVAQPSYELGVAAAEILLRKIAGAGEPPGAWSRTLPTRLVVRDST